jgi:hypothetical protein
MRSQTSEVATDNPDTRLSADRTGRTQALLLKTLLRGYWLRILVSVREGTYPRMAANGKASWRKVIARAGSNCVGGSEADTLEQPVPTIHLYRGECLATNQATCLTRPGASGCVVGDVLARLFGQVGASADPILRGRRSVATAKQPTHAIAIAHSTTACDFIDRQIGFD